MWDFGEHEVAGPAGYDAAMALRDGVLRFALYGKKLQGQWAMIRTAQGRRENWLLEKIRDEFAQADYNPESEPKSALSGKVLRDRL